MWDGTLKSRGVVRTTCVLALLSVAFPLQNVLAQENEECLACHEDTELTGERSGEEIKVFVAPEAFLKSVHADLSCVDCHMDLADTDLPHEEQVEPVDCAFCHDDVAEEQASGPHGNWAEDAFSVSAACMSCHGYHDVRSQEDPESTVSRRNVVDLCTACHDSEGRDLEASPHGNPSENGPGATCVDCHRGHAVQAPADPIALLDSCGVCHEQEARQHSRSLHGRAAIKGDPVAPSCTTCHGHHRILPKTDFESPTAVMNVPLLCGRCHHEGTEVSLTHDISQDRILENYSLSIHGEGLFQRGLTVTAVCTSCHTAHNILDHNHPESSINANNVAATCTQCHARIEEVHVKVIEGRLWEEEPHKIPSCVECHQPHKIRRRPVNLSEAVSAACMKCHSDPTLSMEKDGETISLYVDGEAYGLGAHARIQCAQCHTEVTPSRRGRACAMIENPVDCGICHAEVVNLYETSAHGSLAKEGDPDAPTCLDCHEKHYTEDHRIPTAKTFSRNIPELCGECHALGGSAATRVRTDIPDIVSSYVESAHGKGLLESGLVVSATCTDCHSTHHMLPKTDPESSVHPASISETCGTCHQGIEEEFKTSIHWPENVDIDQELPNCEDCHTSHTISRTDAPGFRMMMMDQCGRCHEDESATFFETMHGKVTQLGDEGAAKCYDCHGTHNILPTEDPRSTLSHDNVVSTCATCHPGAHRQFAGYLTHATHHDPDKYPYLFYAFWFMTSLLIGTFTFFSLHTLLWLWRLYRTREKWAPLKETTADRFYIRFNQTQRIMHLIMLISFFTLALTGMALKFSYMEWAQTISNFLGGFEVMGTLHRMGGVTLLSLFAFHMYQLVGKRKQSGKSWPAFIFDKNSLMFNLNDLTQFSQSIMWFLGKGERPAYGRFTYWEKFDYFAVFWGVLVIGSTGLILWFPELFTRILPGWSVNVATIIHSDEALLAVGFIFTIHFFNTHFRPDKFPMDPVIFTGRVSVEELAHDKPEEYREFIKEASQEELDKRITGDASPRFARAAKIFGFAALAVGLIMILLIIYTMLFGYR